MNKKLVISAVLVAGIAMVAGIWLAQQQRKPSVLGPASMIPFTLPDTKGVSQKIEQWQGKVVLLNFWATWCPPCREEIPAFVEVQEQFGAKGFQIIGVAIDNKDDVTDFMDTFFINYPVLLGDDKTLNLMSQYGNRIGSLPYSVIMDRQGKIVARKIGAYTKKNLVKLIKPHL